MTDTSLAPASRSRALFAIILVNFVSLAGFGLMFPVFAIYSRQIGASGMEIAGAVAAFSLGQFLSSPFWGRWSDRFGRRPVMIAGLVTGALVYVLHIFALSPLTLLAARFVSGLATGSFSITFAVASDLSTRDNRTHVMGMVSAGFSLGFIFGPAIGGVTASLTGQDHAFALVCVVGAALGLVAALLTWWLMPETRTQAPAPHDASSPVDGGPLLRRPGFLAAIVIALVVSAAFAQMESILGLFADDVLDLDPLGIGLMFGAMGTVTTLTQFTVTGRVASRFGETGMLYLSLAIIAVGLAVLGLADGLALAGLGLLFTSTGFALVNPAVSGLVSMASPPQAQGAGLGVMQSANALGRVVGPLAAGPLYDLQGEAAPLFWGSGLLLATLLAMPLVRLPAREARR
ncbi:MFS transporter [Novosphingobium profundi]|uniref:MFS transporter n=1 Tax=Novosphingobium profundi TaxID=1774954 RepID=UPI001BDA572D|nr:MFS transporter [Novosphingobium profundi]MBT0668208.1 MFS transporter [Novosphingobium profundi]